MTIEWDNHSQICKFWQTPWKWISHVLVFCISIVCIDNGNASETREVYFFWHILPGDILIFFYRCFAEFFQGPWTLCRFSKRFTARPRRALWATCLGWGLVMERCSHLKVFWYLISFAVNGGTLSCWKKSGIWTPLQRHSQFWRCWRKFGGW